MLAWLAQVRSAMARVSLEVRNTTRFRKAERSGKVRVGARGLIPVPRIAWGFSGGRVLGAVKELLYDSTVRMGRSERFKMYYLQWQHHRFIISDFVDRVRC
jgi:hypothetical protein